jgi:hypothetical protein
LRDHVSRDFSRIARLGEIGRQLVSYPALFCDPIIIGLHIDQVGPDAADVRSATGTLVRIGERNLLVTCHHVIEAYRRSYIEDDRTIFQFLDQVFDPLAILIDEDERRDIATLDFSGFAISRPPVGDVRLPHDIQVCSTGQRMAHEVRNGEIVFFGGWPEVRRTQIDGGRELSHQFFGFAGIPVTGAFEGRFTCSFDRTEWESVYGPTEDPNVQERQLSGLSGGPVFRDRGNQINFDLVGFITAYSPTYDLLNVSSIENIRSDGGLRH